MGRFRRKRIRPQWFPTYGDEAGDDALFSFRTFTIDVAGDSVATLSVPVTIDDTQENLAANTLIEGDAFTLADIQSTSWRLRRIVGKIFVAWFPSTTDWQDSVISDGTAAIVAGAGFMVQKTNETGGNAAPLLPKSTLDGTTQQDPWIWRRSWALGQGYDPVAVGVSDPTTITGYEVPKQGAVPPFPLSYAAASFPPNNVRYGSALDGPHIDTKIGRVIGPDDRLFLNMCVAPILTGSGTDTGQACFIVDVRLLGNILRTSNRRNATR